MVHKIAWDVLINCSALNHSYGLTVPVLFSLFLFRFLPNLVLLHLIAYLRHTLFYPFCFGLCHKLSIHYRLIDKLTFHLQTTRNAWASETDRGVVFGIRENQPGFLLGFAPSRKLLLT